MQDKCSFEYAIIRIVPRVEREEFINVGAIVYCAAQKFLKAKIELSEERLVAFAPQLDLSQIRQHLKAIELICEGGKHTGEIGNLPANARFRWLTAPRSTIVQTSAVHTGLCGKAEDVLEHLLETMVRIPVQK